VTDAPELIALKCAAAVLIGNFVFILFRGGRK
jgi:hypothetical protein